MNIWGQQTFYSSVNFRNSQLRRCQKTIMVGMLFGHGSFSFVITSFKQFTSHQSFSFFFSFCMFLNLFSNSRSLVPFINIHPLLCKRNTSIMVIRLGDFCFILMILCTSCCHLIFTPSCHATKLPTNGEGKSLRNPATRSKTLLPRLNKTVRKARNFQ